MFLRNHGLVILGDTLEEAFARACSAVLACESQVRMMPVGIENLVIISDEAKKRSAEVAKRMNEFAASGRGTVRLGGEGGDQTLTEGEEPKEKPRTRDPKWRQGDMEFEAYMRMLDNSVSGNLKEPFFYGAPAVELAFIPCTGFPDRLSVPCSFGSQRVT